MFKKMFAVLSIVLFLSGSVVASEPMFPKYDKKGNSNIEKIVGVSGFFLTAISLFVIFDEQNEPKIFKDVVKGASLCAGLVAFNSLLKVKF